MRDEWVYYNKINNIPSTHLICILICLWSLFLPYIRPHRLHTAPLYKFYCGAYMTLNVIIVLPVSPSEICMASKGAGAWWLG